jgi:hypothetical protein
VLTYYAKNATGQAVNWNSDRISASDIDGNNTVDAVDASDILTYYAYTATGGKHDIESYFKIVNQYTTGNYGIDSQDHNLYYILSVELTDNGKMKITAERDSDFKGTDKASIIEGCLYGVYSGEEAGTFTIDLTKGNSAVIDVPKPSPDPDVWKYMIGADAYLMVDDIKIYLKNVHCTEISFTKAEISLAGTTLKSHDTIPVYNIQNGDPYLEWTATVTEADKKLIKKFWEEETDPSLPLEYRLAEAAGWINENVDYADSAESQALIGGKTWFDAVYNAHTGQCIQYNGAMAELLAYLGFDVYMVRGYIYGTQQHYWCEVNIDGVYYSLNPENKKYGSYTAGDIAISLVPIASSVF